MKTIISKGTPGVASRIDADLHHTALGGKEWPKLKRDYKGLRVRVVKPFRNNGGERAEIGRTATIEGWYCGLKLSIDVCDKCGTKMYITRVPQSSVELI